MLNSMSATKLFATCMDSIVIKIVNTNGPDCDGPIEFGKISSGFFWSLFWKSVPNLLVKEKISKKKIRKVVFGLISLCITMIVGLYIRIHFKTINIIVVLEKEKKKKNKCFAFVCIHNDMIIGWCNKVSYSFIGNFSSSQ